MARTLFIDGLAPRRRCPHCKAETDLDGLFGMYEYHNVRKHLIRHFCGACWPGVTASLRYVPPEENISVRCHRPDWLWFTANGEPERPPDADPLLREIHAAPRDWGRWLVYADRVEELGFPWQALFLRLRGYQVKPAKRGLLHDREPVAGKEVTWDGHELRVRWFHASTNWQWFDVRKEFWGEVKRTWGQIVPHDRPPVEPPPALFDLAHSLLPSPAEV